MSSIFAGSMLAFLPFQTLRAFAVPQWSLSPVAEWTHPRGNAGHAGHMHEAVLCESLANLQSIVSR
jgi:hypothetical protein